MNCKRAMKSFLQLDNRRSPDGALMEHLRSCARCRAEYDGLRTTLNMLRPDRDSLVRSGASPGGGSSPPDDALSERIMAAVRVRERELRTHKPESGRAHADVRADYGRWAASGTLILFGMVTLPYSAVVNYLRELPGSRIDVTLALAFGLLLSAFMGAFIASHLEHLSRLLRRDSAS